MKPQEKTPVRSPWNDWLFVLILLSAFLFVMVMSIKQEGFQMLEKDFFQKKLLIENFNRLRMKVGDRVFNNALIGKDGWMEFTGDKNLDDYQNVVNLSPDSLQTIARTIENCYQYTRAHNITFLMVIAPNKASIYPDKLPDQIRPLSNLSRLDQLNNYLRTQNIPEVLDLRPVLRSARQQQNVYYKLGTHWNEYGAYVAYETIIKSLAKNYPDLEPYSAKFFRFRRVSPIDPSVADKGIAGMLQANYLTLEPNFFSTRNIDEVVHNIEFPNTASGYHRVSWIPNSDLPSLLMFHDSFGMRGLNNFLSLNFSKAFYIHRTSSPLYFNQQVIEQFSPDILLYEVVERDLPVIQIDLSRCNTK